MIHTSFCKSIAKLQFSGTAYFMKLHKFKTIVVKLENVKDISNNKSFQQKQCFSVVQHTTLHY